MLFNSRGRVARHCPGLIVRTLVHISDIHFGRVDNATVAPLRRAIEACQPDLVAISGDLTQRARTGEFREAREFLGSLPSPQIVVPGNHDIPMHNLYARFVHRLDKYQRYITQDLEPVFADEEMVVVGINTARSATIKNGRINTSQVGRMQKRLCAVEAPIVKVVVTHHPFDLPNGFQNRDLLGRAAEAMPGLAKCGADLFLSGHLHVGFTGNTAVRYAIAGHAALIVQAGTATSTRGRGEPNSFNVIRIHHPQIEVERLTWESSACDFRRSHIQKFHRGEHGWAELKSAL